MDKEQALARIEAIEAEAKELREIVDEQDRPAVKPGQVWRRDMDGVVYLIGDDLGYTVIQHQWTSITTGYHYPGPFIADECTYIGMAKDVLHIVDTKPELEWEPDGKTVPPSSDAFMSWVESVGGKVRKSVWKSVWPEIKYFTPEFCGDKLVYGKIVCSDGTVILVDYWHLFDKEWEAYIGD